MDRTTRALTAALTRGLLLVLVVGGLLLMHGLDLHGTAAAAEPVTHHAPAAVAHHGAPGPSGRPVTAPSGMDMGAMGLCVAVLAGAVLLLRAHRRTTGGVLARPRWAARVLGPRGRRDRDPPRLSALSLLRC